MLFPGEEQLGIFESGKDANPLGRSWGISKLEKRMRGEKLP